MTPRFLEPLSEGYRDSFRLAAGLFLAVAAVVTAFVSNGPLPMSNESGEQSQDSR
jgi:hypothetical protein